MAKNDNLKDFVTDLADAIREKKGTTDLINPQDFADEISNLPSGGEVQNTTGFTAEVFDATKIGMDNFRTIRVADGVKTFEANTFFTFKHVEELYIPASATSIGLLCVAPARLKTIIVDDNNTAYDSRGNCNAIIKKETLYNKDTLILGGNLTIIPDDVEALGYACMQGALLIEHIDVPPLVTTISSYAFADCTALKRVIVKGDITQIANYAFRNDTAMELYDFTHCTSIPTMSGLAAFNKIPTTCKIIVPDALYDSWISATNWSTYADRIVKSSEYTES